MENNTQILIVMIAYMALLISWGIYQGRKVKTSSDYAIAGRSLPGWMAALSERATGESSWALLGFRDWPMRLAWPVFGLPLDVWRG